MRSLVLTILLVASPSAGALAQEMTALKAVLAGWQIAGITTIDSGQPIPRILEDTNGFRCNPSTDTFGQILNTRAPREIQLGFKFYW